MVTPEEAIEDRYDQDWIYLEDVKYSNSCIECDRFIRKGERAYWCKGIGIKHIRCEINASDSVRALEILEEIDPITYHNIEEELAINETHVLAFASYRQSKQKKQQLTFPHCQRCGKSNDVQELRLCEPCLTSNYLDHHGGNDLDYGNGKSLAIIEEVSRLRSNPDGIFVTYTPGILDILNIQNGEQRYQAVKDYGIEKIIDELDAKLINRSKRGNELFEVDLFQPSNAKILRYRDPSTDEIYADLVPTHIYKADEAMASKFHLTEVEYDGLEVEG